MKHLLIIAAIFVPISASNAAMTICQTLDTCGSVVTSSSPYCCKNGTQQTCPTGWTLSGSTCSRANTTSSDTKGYYTQSYGTCSPTTTQCYKPSSSGTNSDGTSCFKKYLG